MPPSQQSAGVGTTTKSTTPPTMSPLEDILYPPPTSPEEAGALLGASITRLEPTLLSQNLTAIPPPGGDAQLLLDGPAGGQFRAVRAVGQSAEFAPGEGGVGSGAF